jgi:hypothetical protein
MVDMLWTLKKKASARLPGSAPPIEPGSNIYSAAKNRWHKHHHAAPKSINCPQRNAKSSW